VFRPFAPGFLLASPVFFSSSSRPQPPCGYAFGAVLHVRRRHLVGVGGLWAVSLASSLGCRFLLAGLAGFVVGVPRRRWWVGALPLLFALCSLTCFPRGWHLRVPRLPLGSSGFAPGRSWRFSGYPFRSSGRCVFLLLAVPPWLLGGCLWC